MLEGIELKISAWKTCCEHAVFFFLSTSVSEYLICPGCRLLFSSWLFPTQGLNSCSFSDSHQEMRFAIAITNCLITLRPGLILPF